MERKIEQLVELRYDKPIFEGGAEFPSALRFSASSQKNEMVLTYAYKKCMQGVQLRHYLDIARLARNKNACYLEGFVEAFAWTLWAIIQKKNKLGNYYRVLELENIYIIDKEKINIEIDIPII